jgi:tetratricopeptide (TPR) repeat protein
MRTKAQHGRERGAHPGAAVLAAGVVLLALATAAVAAEPPAAKPGQQAKIMSLQNQVEAKPSAAAGWTPAAIDQALFAKDRVRTGAASRATILYADQTAHRLNEKSEVEVVAPEGDKPGLLRVLSGQHYFSSRKPKDFGRVETPTVTAAIKGTEFVVDVSADGGTTITMLEGVVEATNQFGGVSVTAGEKAVVEPGKAPVKAIVLRPRDAVNWSLYYPPVLGGADAERLKGMGSDGAELSKAAQLLSVGQVSSAVPLIDGVRQRQPNNPIALALASVVELTEDNKAEAQELAKSALAADEKSPAANLAGSFAAQSQFDLDRAGTLAERAAQLDPEDATALIRVAELRMAKGDIAGARRAAKSALKRNPDDAHALTVLGFAELAVLRADAARPLFEQAIARDPAFPLARLGLGLAQIRQGDLTGGREQMQTAAALDPTNSLLRSYLGKAYYEEKRSEEAGKEYATAKALDPSDPTPWLYSAFLKQNDNRPVEALGDIQESIALNDRRAVYRSRLLLDEDLAVRSADLSQVYNQLGFDQLGLVTARRSADTDQANYSSHLSIAGSYRELAGYAPAFLSEVLQARIYQPPTVNAVRPDIVNDSVSFNEYTALFDSPRWRAFGRLTYGQTDEDLSELIPADVLCYPPPNFEPVPCIELAQLDSSTAKGGDFTVTNNGERYAAALSFRTFDDDGFRQNADQSNDDYRGFVQFMVSDVDSVQVNAIYGKRDTGDLPIRQYPQLISPERFETTQQNYALGWHRKLSPQSDLAVSAIYNKTEQTGSSTLFPLSTTGTLSGPQLEAQYVRRQARSMWTVGAGAFDGSVKAENQLASYKADDSFLNGYAYAKFRTGSAWEWTAGAAVEQATAPVGLVVPRDSNIGLGEIEHEDTVISPKLGVTASFRSGTTLRAAIFHRLNPALGRVQSLEPTQVAGFNQYFEDPAGTTAWNYGIGLDQAFGKRVFMGLAYQRRDLDVPEASCDDPNPFSGCGFQAATKVVEKSADIDLASFYFNWAIGRQVAASIEYEWTREDFDTTSVNPFGLFQDYIETGRLRPQVRWFLPFGLFLGAGATQYDQTVEQTDDLSSDARQVIESDFWIYDATLGYRFPDRWGTLAVDVRNATNEKFTFYERAIQDVFVPSRQILLRLEITY